MSQLPNPDETVREAVSAAHRYFELTNQVIGFLSFNAGLACISTNRPQLYAFIAALFALLAWGEGVRAFDARLRILRNIKHPVLRSRYVWRQSVVALVGWAFLGLVAVGLLNTNGPAFP